MLSDGIRPIGDGLLDVAEERLQALLVPQDINEVYEVEQTPFARGKFAAVRRAVHKSSGIHFAAKFLRRRRRAQSSDKEIRHEIAVLMLCSGSENIVKLNAVHESRSDTALLLELATGGELQAILDDEGSLTEAQARFCMRQVLKALQFLHKKSIAHLDLKPQNILLAGKRVEDGLKLCDFGISRVIENGSKIREILGTPDYVAPEVLQYEPLSLQTDIWSVGVLAYVLLTGCSPFGGDTKQETFLNISQCSLTFPDDLFKDISNGAMDFIKSTLRIKADDRLTAFECLEHVWLKEDSSLGSSTFLTVMKTDRHDSIDLEDCERDSSKYNEQFKTATSAATATINGYKSDNGLESHQKYNTSNGHVNHVVNEDDVCVNDDDASNDHDKENFLANSPLAKNSNAKTLCSLYSLQKYGNESNKLNAQYKLHSPANTTLTTTSTAASKFSTTNGKLLNMMENRCSPIGSQHKSPISNGLSELEYARNCLEKVRSPAAVSAVSHTTSILPATAVTTASICLFPDAPTTPKVIRKTPAETTRSVKALVKKFQLENDTETTNGMGSACITATNHESEHIDDEYRVIDSANHNHSNCSNSVVGGGNGSSPNGSGSSNFKSTCVFCLTCGGPGCRHSGRTTVTKSSGNLGIDQGIIC